MAKQASVPKGTRSIRMEGYAIICANEGQMLFISGFRDVDPGGDVIWDQESPKMSLKMTCAAAREIVARKSYTILAPKGTCFVRVELKDGFLVGTVGDVEVLRINTRSQISKASANTARIIATACGMNEAEMAPMFAYPAQPVLSTEPEV